VLQGAAKAASPQTPDRPAASRGLGSRLHPTSPPFHPLQVMRAAPCRQPPVTPTAHPVPATASHMAAACFMSRLLTTPSRTAMCPTARHILQAVARMLFAQCMWCSPHPLLCLYPSLCIRIPKQAADNNWVVIAGLDRATIRSLAVLAGACTAVLHPTSAAAGAGVGICFTGICIACKPGHHKSLAAATEGERVTQQLDAARASMGHAPPPQTWSTSSPLCLHVCHGMWVHNQIPAQKHQLFFAGTYSNQAVATNSK
jgi:hypothetical protein